MIKVLHILTRLIRGGADENTLATVIGLDKNEFDVDLLVGGDSDPGFMQEASEHANILCEPFLRRDVKPASDLMALYKLYRTIHQGQYDLVHTHTAKAGFLGRIAAKMAGTPYIVHTVHGVTFHDFRYPLTQALYLEFEKIAARMTDRFIAVGEDLKNHYIQHGIGKPDSYTVIRSGIDLSRFFAAAELSEDRKQQVRREWRLQPSDRVVGLVSRLDTGKGQEYLIEAARQIIPRFPSVKFLLVGDGMYRERFEQMARDYQLTSSIIFTGFRHDIAEVIAMFDIAAFTSLWEGMPRVIAQYAAEKKPIVAFDIKGVSEIVKHGVNGFTVPVKDIERLAKRVLYLLENPAEGQRMGAAGRQFLDESWDVNVMVCQIAQQYRQLIRGKLL